MARRNGMSDGARELKLFIDSDAQLYHQQFEPILKNLMTKIGRGTYDSAKSVKLWGYLCESGAKKYVKEFGGTWNHVFTVADRKQCAEALRDDFEAEAQLGNYDNLLPKKYRKNPDRKPSKATKKAAKRAADRLVRARGSLKGPPGYWTEAEVYWEMRGISLIVNWQGHEMYFQGDDAYYALENMGIDPDDVSKIPSMFEVPETIMDEYAHLNWNENPKRSTATKQQLLKYIANDPYLSAYFECALWSSTDEDGEPLDSNYSVEDCTKDALSKLFTAADAFLTTDGVYRIIKRDMEQAGHDLWLSREGHGSGFFDGHWGKDGDFLQDVAERIGPADLYTSGKSIHAGR